MSSLAELIGAHTREVPDFPQPGVLFRDLTPLFGNGSAFRQLIDEIGAQVSARGPVDLVAGIEARGFLLAAALGYSLGVGVLPIRKVGKSPPPTASESYALEYGEATIELRADAVAADDRVLIIDDVLATGGTLVAASKLLRGLGAVVVDSWVLIELAALGGSGVLAAADVPFTAASTV